MIKKGYAIFVFLQRANGGRRRNRGGEEGGRSSGHNLNITNEFISKFYRKVYFIGNPFYINNMLL